MFPGLINGSKQRASSALATAMTNGDYSPSATAAKFVSRMLTPADPGILRTFHENVPSRRDEPFHART